MPRDRSLVHADGRSLIPPDQILAVCERDLAIAPEKPIDHSGSGGLGGVRRRKLRRFRPKGVTEPLDRSNDALVMGVIAECRAQLVDQVREIPVDDESVGPKTLMQILLRDGIGPLAKEQLQELKRLVGQPNGLAAAKKLARAQVEEAILKAKSHPTCRNPRSRLPDLEDFDLPIGSS